MAFQVNILGKSGVLIGFMALAIALSQFWLGPPGTTKSDYSLGHIISLGSIFLAFFAILIGTISFLKKENLRYSGVSITLGVVTLAFHFVLVTIGILFMLAVIYFIISNS